MSAYGTGSDEVVADVGPRLPRAALAGAALLVALVVVGALVARGGASGRPTRLGVLDYRYAGVKGDGLFRIGAPYAVVTPPLVDVGGAPLTLENIELLTTGCHVSVTSTSFFHFRGAGIEIGPGDTPRAQWVPYYGTAPAGRVEGTMLRPGPEFSPSYKEVFTLSIPTDGAFGVTGYRVRFRSEGQSLTETLRVPQVYVPWNGVKARSARMELMNTAQQLLDRTHVSTSGVMRPFACESTATSTDSETAVRGDVRAVVARVRGTPSRSDARHPDTRRLLVRRVLRVRVPPTLRRVRSDRLASSAPQWRW